MSYRAPRWVKTFQAMTRSRPSMLLAEWAGARCHFTLCPSGAITGRNSPLARYAARCAVLCERTFAGPPYAQSVTDPGFSADGSWTAWTPEATDPANDDA